MENLCIEIKTTNKAIKRSEGKNIVTVALIIIVHTYLYMCSCNQITNIV